jgi:hypothetical protein
MHKMLSLTISVLTCSACMSTQSGQLYNMKTGQTSTLQVAAMQYSDGRINGNLPDGAACSGGVSQVSIENARRVSSVTPMLTENSRASVALMNCGPHRVLRCTLARRESGNFSYGECQDEQGTPYSIIF